MLFMQNYMRNIYRGRSSLFEFVLQLEEAIFYLIFYALGKFCNKGKIRFSTPSTMWKWVKAHAGNKFNELADKLATDAINN